MKRRQRNRWTRRLNAVLESIATETDALTSHDRYVEVKEYLLEKVVRLRRRVLRNDTRTMCYEFLRKDQEPSDAVYRVPCVPWGHAQPAIRCDIGVWSPPYVRPLGSARKDT